MILQIVGTSGSGKTHLMRSFIRVMRERYTWKPNFVDGRSVPIGYDLVPRLGTGIYIVGAYEEASTGGCDNIRTIAQVYEQIERAASQGKDVVFEGLFVMNQTRGPALLPTYDREVIILQLLTPLTVCIASINSRRAEAGEGRLLTKKNTIGSFKRAENYCTKMRAAGALIVKINRDEALERMLKLVEG